MMGVQKTRKIKLTRKSANFRKTVKAPGREAPKLHDPVVALNTFPEPITPIKVEKIEDIEIETLNESTFGNVTIPVGAIPFTTCTVCEGVMITVEDRVVHLGQPNCIFNASPASESVIDDIAAYNAEEDSSSPASSIETIEEEEVQVPTESPPTPLSRPKKKRKRPFTSNPSQIDAEQPKRSKLNFDSTAQPEIDDEMIPLIQASYSVRDKKKKPTKKKKLTIHDKKKLIWSCGECSKLFSTQKMYMYHSCGPFVPPNIKY